MSDIVEIDAKDSDNLSKYGVRVNIFKEATNNSIRIQKNCSFVQKLIVDFAGNDNRLDILGAQMPLGTIKFFESSATAVITAAAGRSVDMQVVLYGNAKFVISHPKAVFGLRCLVYNNTSVTINDNALIAEQTTIMTSDHHSIIDLQKKTQINHPGNVVLENNVWLGFGATVLKGVRIGAGSIIGARSVVSKNVGKAELWAGNPARLRKSNHSWVASHPAHEFDIDVLLKQLYVG